MNSASASTDRAHHDGKGLEDNGSGMTSPVKTPRKAAVSAWIGSALEYYDFFIYGSAAALVFPKIFFPAGNPTAATIASLATFGVAYIARPFGSFVLGHLGDTVGRKAVLVITLFGMGIATFLIGALPTYEQIDWPPRCCCLLLRVCQGLAVAGRAVQRELDHAGTCPERRRAFLHQLHPRRHPGRQHPGDRRLHPHRPRYRKRRCSAGAGASVPAQCCGHDRRLVDPPHPAREPGFHRRAGARRRAAQAAEGLVPHLHAGRHQDRLRRAGVGDQHPVRHLCAHLRRQHRRAVPHQPASG